MKDFRFLSVVIITALMLINACNFPLVSTVTTSNTPEPATAFATETSNPNCPDISSYGRIYDHWPSGFKLVSTAPELTWFYTSAHGNLANADAWANECVPESYTVYLSTGPDFADVITYEVTDPVITADPTKLTIEWTIPGGLESMKVYRWMVVGHTNGLVIEEWKINDIHNDELWPPLNTVNMAYKRCTFRTGPECTSGQIDIPLLVFPTNGTVINSLNPILLWNIDSCMPLVFMLQISTTPDFIDPQFSVDPSLGGDYTWQSQRNYPYALVNYALRDCTKYYWRVQGGIGEGGAGGYREWGAFSEIDSFFVDMNNACPTPTPTFTPIPPTKTPTLTMTPKPVVCAGLGHNACLRLSDKCVWVLDMTHLPAGGYCKAK